MTSLVSFCARSAVVRHCRISPGMSSQASSLSSSNWDLAPLDFTSRSATARHRRLPCRRRADATRAQPPLAPCASPPRAAPQDDPCGAPRAEPPSSSRRATQMPSRSPSRAPICAVHRVLARAARSSSRPGPSRAPSTLGILGQRVMEGREIGLITTWRGILVFYLIFGFGNWVITCDGVGKQGQTVASSSKNRSDFANSQKEVRFQNWHWKQGQCCNSPLFLRHTKYYRLHLY